MEIPELEKYQYMIGSPLLFLHNNLSKETRKMVESELPDLIKQYDDIKIAQAKEEIFAQADLLPDGDSLKSVIDEEKNK
jgi:hypothetical protein